jgi:hypothetical protein
MRRHLELIDAVLSAGSNPHQAYLVRSRLRRALVALNRGFSDEQPPADVPGDVDSRARRLEQRALHLCQPSEALDVRWKREWAAVRQELEQLHSELAARDLTRRAA